MSSTQRLDGRGDPREEEKKEVPPDSDQIGATEPPEFTKPKVPQQPQHLQTNTEATESGRLAKEAIGVQP